MSVSPLQRRWIIAVVIFFATVFNYFDRQILAVLKPLLKDQFRMDDSGYAWVVNLFTVCYAIMYPVSGWLVDRFGPKLIMLLGVLGWATASIGAGISQTLAQFAFFRGLLGISEPSNFPVKLKVVTIWFPPKLRATANSFCEAGSSIGAILAPPLAAWIALRFNWQTVFIFGGIVGLIIALIWVVVYRHPPKQMFSENTASGGVKTSDPLKWGELWKQKRLWGILMIRLVSDPLWYFCLFWLPGYLQESSGLSLKEMALFGWIPFLVADIGAIGASSWSDRMVKKGMQPLRSRKIMLTAIACLAPLCAFTPHLPNAYVTIFIFSLVAVTCLTWLFNINVVVAEAFPVGNVSSVLGIAGGFGAVGAILLNYFAGQYINAIGAEQIFLVMAFLHPVAAIILWSFIKSKSK